MNISWTKQLFLGTLLGVVLSLAGCAVPAETTPASEPDANTATAAAPAPTTAVLETEPPAPTTTEPPAAPSPTPERDVQPTSNSDEKPSLADVVAVQVSGQPGAYTFQVTVASPDTGCEQYADWWEIVSPEGELLYRRVLLHSHAGEQPFTRSGGPAPVTADQVVWVRAHMNTGGYGGQALHGSVQQGFEPAELAPDFAAGLAEEEPLPVDCAF